MANLDATIDEAAPWIKGTGKDLAADQKANGPGIFETVRIIRSLNLVSAAHPVEPGSIEAAMKDGGPDDAGSFQNIRRLIAHPPSSNGAAGLLYAGLSMAALSPAAMDKIAYEAYLAKKEAMRPGNLLANFKTGWALSGRDSAAAREKPDFGQLGWFGRILSFLQPVIDIIAPGLVAGIVSASIDKSALGMAGRLQRQGMPDKEAMMLGAYVENLGRGQLGLKDTDSPILNRAIEERDGRQPDAPATVMAQNAPPAKEDSATFSSLLSSLKSDFGVTPAFAGQQGETVPPGVAVKAGKSPENGDADSTKGGIAH